MPVTRTDNSSACISAINGAVNAAMDEIGKKATAYAKGTVHVITGNLRDSIGYEASGGEVTIYAGMPYAQYEELGTSTQDAHPYLKPSVMDHTSEYMDVVTGKLREVM